MGFLKIFGRALEFNESKQFHEIIKRGFIKYTIQTIKNEKICRKPLFGTEFEFHKIKVDDSNKKVLLDITAQNDINNYGTKLILKDTIIAHEYGGWMIEALPIKPLDIFDISHLEESINKVYKELENTFGNEGILSFASFPMISCFDYFSEDDYYKGLNEEKEENSQNIKKEEKEEKEVKEEKEEKKDINNNPYSKSQFLKDMIINRHPRFGCLTRNIRLRRGKKVEIKIPIFKDINTNLTASKEEPFPNFIYMDAMGFGMGNSCLQMTLGACCLKSASHLYDQLIPFTSIFLALSSCSPFYKGKISNYDNRWSVISQSVDDRNDDERNINSNKFIYKSRYSHCYSYISDTKFSHDFNNDYKKFPINESYYNELIKGGLSKKLSMHFANLLVRDPLVIFSEKVNLNDDNDNTHFENINSTNWNSLRFKLPRPSDGDTSFKIEVRPCDIQITPFENTSMVAFILSVYCIIFNYDCNFIIPISKTDINFERAFQRDAINNQKFFWRINSLNQNKGFGYDCFKFNSVSEEEREKITYEEDQENIKELTINEIINGCPSYNYPGLIKYAKEGCHQLFKSDILDKYLDFISRKAKGELWTDAKYVRNFVLNHPKYNHDSILTEEINYDLIKHILKIQRGEIKPKELFNGVNFKGI